MWLCVGHHIMFMLDSVAQNAICAQNVQCTIWNVLPSGISLLNLRDSYYSAQLKTIVLWCDIGYEVKWKGMQEYCSTSNKWRSQINNNFSNHLSPFITSHTWFDVIKQFNLWTQFKKKNFFGWVAYDIWIYIHNGQEPIIKLSDTREKYNLEKHDSYSYANIS